MQMNYYRGASTIAKIVRIVCCVIWKHLSSQNIPPITKQILEDVAIEFDKKANFPNCIGALDETNCIIVDEYDVTTLEYASRRGAASLESAASPQPILTLRHRNAFMCFGPKVAIGRNRLCPRAHGRRADKSRAAPTVSLERFTVTS
ncbi:hypothetical protein EVAR_47921_1 [Eumeta japonica]|uniref:DDE Tnp4 domain-containing protein n=1 Tax=Eumeta variegata TaxID=151549 RepID=A0A4C1Y3R4_EUMVA|nr:hypothetical protein EVAR_47921_1 [Eumeta japonica]